MICAKKEGVNVSLRARGGSRATTRARDPDALEILNAAKSSRSLPSTPRPPKTYMTSSTSVAAWPSRGTGM